MRHPIRVVAQHIVPDTEGAGRFRGAPSAYVEYGPIGTELVVAYGADGTEHAALGARGGLSGGPANTASGSATDPWSNLGPSASSACRPAKRSSRSPAAGVDTVTRSSVTAGGWSATSARDGSRSPGAGRSTVLGSSDDVAASGGRRRTDEQACGRHARRPSGDRHRCQRWAGTTLCRTLREHGASVLAVDIVGSDCFLADAATADGNRSMVAEALPDSSASTFSH